MDWQTPELSALISSFGAILVNILGAVYSRRRCREYEQARGRHYHKPEFTPEEMQQAREDLEKELG